MGITAEAGRLAFAIGTERTPGTTAWRAAAGGDRGGVLGNGLVGVCSRTTAGADVQPPAALVHCLRFREAL
jgi:hypothetical protein